MLNTHTLHDKLLLAKTDMSWKPCTPEQNKEIYC